MNQSSAGTGGPIKLKRITVNKGGQNMLIKPQGRNLNGNQITTSEETRNISE